MMTADLVLHFRRSPKMNVVEEKLYYSRLGSVPSLSSEASKRFRGEDRTWIRPDIEKAAFRTHDVRQCSLRERTSAISDIVVHVPRSSRVANGSSRCRIGDDCSATWAACCDNETPSQQALSALIDTLHSPTVCGSDGAHPRPP
jgi:hypothetical protein